jgi:hypothetical protein
MMNIVRAVVSVSIATCLAASLSGCDSAKEEPAVCPEGDVVDGQCAGVPPNAVCAEDSCTSGLDCAKVVSASDDPSLASAAASATAGTCIVLAPGSYSEVALPGGVSLLGKSADDVSVSGVTLGAGDGAVVRGLTVSTGGILVNGAQGARIEAVRVTGAEAVGIQIAAGSSVSLVTSTVEASAHHGVAVADGALVTIQQTILADNGGPGLWSACSADCACTARPDVAILASFVRDNHIGGVVVFTTDLSLQDVEITGTLPGDDWNFGLGGGGLSVAVCSDLSAMRLRSLDNTRYGVLIDDSSAQVGDPAGEPGIEISRNKIGFWAQNISKSAAQTVNLDGATLESNEGVGVGVDGDSMGLIICKSGISGTTMGGLIVAGGDSQEIGDGILWLGGSEVLIDDVTISGSARASVLIDGEAGGALSDVTLSGGDEAKGIVQQNYAGGMQPQIGENTPALTSEAAELFTTPEAPESIPRNL